MGANTLGKLVKHAAEYCGINNKRLTNHSVTQICVSTLSKSGIPPNKIMQVTGHKNISSIAAYDTALSFEEQTSISTILNQGGSFPAHDKKIGGGNPVSSTSLEMKVPPATQTAQAQISAAEHAISTAQDLQSSLFKGAIIQTLNLNIQIK
ncbi:uncharacterized protein LOC128546900 [Mercenaria mercenaria]|uniref:uncharacterized protein LOC128546900 n=1 Tax=Mercenaria mercenaria TaxID=6596 RepID=UPI00234EE9FD|nr:uncharacterized protein LOC128546900 [Mercenaria mercenaria]